MSMSRSTPEKHRPNTRSSRGGGGGGGVRVAVVGGGGFVGRALLARLALGSPVQQSERVSERVREGVREGVPVEALCVLDLLPPASSCDAVKFYRVDVTEREQVERALQDFGPSSVVHLAGWGMSGAPMLSMRCHEVNALGTRNVIDACQKLSSHCSLVYLSTYNVIFGGQEILGGSEDEPYFQGQHSDQYAPSKTLAEKAVVEANSPQVPTCVIRPAAIYGPGEERHFPRIVRTIDSGLFLVRIGHALVDWVHVDNLVQAIELAVLKLSSKQISPKDRNPTCGDADDIGGEVFFVSDGTPIGNFDFLQPLCTARGVRGPLMQLPVALALQLANLVESIYYLSKTILGDRHAVEPFLTVPEVLKVGISHYFSIDKAKQKLGYAPSYSSEEGARQMAAHYRQHLNNQDFFQLVHPAIGMLIALGMFLLTFFAVGGKSTVPYFDLLYDNMHVWGCDGSFVTRRNLQVVLVGAHMVHVYKARQAMIICDELGVRSGLKLCWAMQTFVFGIGSLSILHARQDFMRGLHKNK